MRKYHRRASSSSQKPPLPSFTPITLARLPEMTLDEGRAWVEGMRTRLVAKQQRERAYLDRRAARKTHTPTDDAYEDDQQLETELLTLLDDLLTGLTADDESEEKG